METEEIQEVTIPTSRVLPFEISLSQEQAAYINSLLPKCFSLQQVVKKGRKASRDLDGSQLKAERSVRVKRQHEMRLEIGRSEDGETGTPRKIHLSRLSRDSQSVRQAPQVSQTQNNGSLPGDFQGDAEMMSCFHILIKLKRHDCAGPFLQQVDPVAQGVPDYLTIIKQPMDLGLIERNLRSGQYATATQFHADLNKIFTNSYRYNQKGTEVHKLTLQLEKFYNKLMSDMMLEENSNELQNRLALTNRHVAQYISQHAPKKKRKQQQQHFLNENQIDSLSRKIKLLPNTCIAEVLKIVTESRSYLTQPIRNIQEIDIKLLEMHVLVELDRYLKLKVSPHPRKRKPREPKKMPSIEKSFEFAKDLPSDQKQTEMPLEPNVKSLSPSSFDPAD